MSLKSITTEATHQPNIILFHGPPGVGKTELGAHFPAPIFLMTRGEKGLITLMQYNRVPKTPHFPEPADNWQDILDAIDELTESEHQYKTFVVDVLNGAERLCHEMVCTRDYKGDWGKTGFENYAAGYRTSINDWRHLLAKLERLRDVRKMTIVGLCHTKVSSMRNPHGDDYDSYTPSMYKETWQITHGWADMVFYCQQEVFAKKDKNEMHAKGVTGKRVICTDLNAAYLAKNRHGLPSEIDMGTSGKEAFANLMSALAVAKAAKE